VKFPNRIRELRLARGLSQAALAERADTDQSTIDRLEKGGRRLTDHYMRRISTAMQVSVADLVPGASLGPSLEPLEAEILERFRKASHVNRMAIVHILRSATGEPDEASPFADLTTPTTPLRRDRLHLPSLPPLLVPGTSKLK